ncbi:hypothetical protein D3C78_45110 [compost metagenome]
MTQVLQPEALRFAAICETKGMFPVADELNRMHARILELEQGKCLHQIAEPAAQGLDAQQYRLIDHGELIEAGDEFLMDDFMTWEIDPKGIFVGTPLGIAFRPARRAIAAQAKHGVPDDQ